MNNREAILELLAKTCYDCPYGCDSASTGEFLVCDYRNASIQAIQALKVVDTLSTLIEQGKVSSVTTDQLKQVLDEYIGERR